MSDITSVRVKKTTHADLLKVIGFIQLHKGSPVTLDDALKEILDIYKKKNRIV